MITASIVTYNNNPILLEKAIKSFLNQRNDVKIYIIDNSPTDHLKALKHIDKNIEYHFINANPGFGAAHNLAIEKSIELGAKYHFIVNPDIYFEKDVISLMVDFMESDSKIGMMMPEILNEDGTVQFLPKLLPTPINILLRKLKRPKAKYDEFINNYELRFVPRYKIYNAPILSGCFTLLNLNAIKDVGAYDDSFFMYFEDWDLSRRMHKKYKTIYYPNASIYHEYESGANKNFKLFKIFLKSAVNYFNKWGWFFDKDRAKINSKALAQFK